ncbi:MAG TPA: PQQ-dependent sugar dehydrogenase [Thermoanaerobaculia bacterium]|nr:PQQ-dependent sugar dehydrogenase [Thermoanaerobaculia bacterium]
MSRLFIRYLAAALTLAFSCAALAAAPWPRIALNRVAAGFSNLTQVTSAHDGSGRLFVVEQRGLVKIVRDGAVLPTPFLDISGRVSCCGERGLLSIVFPPGSGSKGQFWADYTDVNGDTTISLFSVSGATASAVSETVILKIAQPFANHNGGQLAFGPDGYLYVGMGDGGSAGDPNNNAQNTGSLLGKILRIDVRASPYGIPRDNPFAGSSTARREIWAYGLRNPWRFSFDRKTGDLYIGDVGQGTWEEVDFQPAVSGGGENYGWRLTEGNHCFNPATGCSFAGITPPVAEYSHESGCSITGGFVYRGRDFARLDGIYFYADYCSGRVWGLRRNGTGWETQELLQPGFGFTSFGEDDAGEVYAVDGNSGTLYRLVDADGALSVLTVPVVVDAKGANGEHFVSEITLGNRGTTDATVDVTFTAASALGSSGSGRFTTAVPAGRQLVFADALQWLRQNGLSVPLGDQGGTLRLAHAGLSSGDAAFASVRTLAVLPEGRAGLAYPALSPNETLDAPAALYGLRENTVFRSNVALLHAGDVTTGGPITLRVTAFNGAAGDGRSVTLPDVTLGPGQWAQLNRVLQSAGYANGWATVERVAGTDSFYAYGVVNDNLTGDGAFVAPERVGRTAPALTLPAAVHTSAFTTELVLTNPGSSPIQLSFQAHSGRDVFLEPHEQRFIPDVVSYLGIAEASAFSLVIGPSAGGAVAFHASARTFSSTPVGGTFGVAYPAIASSEAALSETWIYGLKQDGLSRSNLAMTVVNPPAAFPSDNPPPSPMTVDFFDGDSGLFKGTSIVPLQLRGDWKQVNSVLSSFGIRNGYVRVRAPAGNFQPFLAYGVVNDGAVPGQGTGDGSYLAMTSVK